MKKPSGSQTDESAQSLVDIAVIDRLAKIVAQYDLTEVEISLGELRVRLARQSGTIGSGDRCGGSRRGARRGHAPARRRRSGRSRAGARGSLARSEVADGRHRLFAGQS